MGAGRNGRPGWSGCPLAAAERLIRSAASALLLLATALLPFHGLAFRLGPLPLRPLELVLALAALAAIPLALRDPAAWVRRRPFDGPVAATVALGLLALALHHGPGESGRTLRLVILEPALYYLLLTRLLAGTAGARQWSAALVIGALAAGGLGFVQLATGHGPIEAEGVDRIRGPYPSPNNLGLLLDRAVPIGVGLALSPGGALSLWTLGAIATIVALGLTYSIGAWLATAAAVSLLLLLLRRWRLLTLLIAVALAAAVVVVALRPERVFSPATTSTRVLLWGSAARMLADNPLSGVGLDNFLYRYSPDHAAEGTAYMHPDAWREPNLSHPHNLLLDWWLSLGVGGAVVLAWTLWRAARAAASAWRSASDDPARRTLVGALIAAFAAGLVHGQIDNSYFLPDLAILWWALLGALGGLVDLRPSAEAARTRPASQPDD